MSRVTVTTSDGVVIESHAFGDESRPGLAAELVVAGYQPTDLWNLSTATLVLMVEDVRNASDDSVPV